MLRIEEIRPKSYEERMTEAIAQIPLYSDEWTNFNVSGPGITILENLTALRRCRRIRSRTSRSTRNAGSLPSRAFGRPRAALPVC